MAVYFRLFAALPRLFAAHIRRAASQLFAVPIPNPYLQCQTKVFERNVP
ncbi:hypothetical protein SAMN05421878_11255 [Actinobaculum suis]|uniref:Uncharacterized protein n=1 Tax=Actinobaculum suis TaxID=1657 RepID=A0A1G7DRC2_9ACTO|nr:hypothetical protein SAMN05421878_11255 [Actinobaculum suis]